MLKVENDCDTLNEMDFSIKKTVLKYLLKQSKLEKSAYFVMILTMHIREMYKIREFIYGILWDQIRNLRKGNLRLK